jgi:galactokinase
MKEENVEFVDQKEENKELKGTSFREFLDGTVITRTNVVKQLPFLIFLCIIAIVYIGNRYHAEKVVRDITRMQEEVKNLRAEEITTASELMKISRQSEVIKLIKEKNLGLEESTDPPAKIKSKY